MWIIIKNKACLHSSSVLGFSRASAVHKSTKRNVINGVVYCRLILSCNYGFFFFLWLSQLDRSLPDLLSCFSFKRVNSVLCIYGVTEFHTGWSEVLRDCILESWEYSRSKLYCGCQSLAVKNFLFFPLITASAVSHSVHDHTSGVSLISTKEIHS